MILRMVNFVLTVICCLLFSSMLYAAGLEVWLTPERAEQLKRVTSRPYVTAQERIDENTVVYRWTNGLHGALTTQRVERVLGSPAKSAWQTRLDAKEAERQALLDDVKAIKYKPTKAALEAIITKHGKK